MRVKAISLHVEDFYTVKCSIHACFCKKTITTILVIRIIVLICFVTIKSKIQNSNVITSSSIFSGSANNTSFLPPSSYKWCGIILEFYDSFIDTMSNNRGITKYIKVLSNEVSAFFKDQPSACIISDKIQGFLNCIHCIIFICMEAVCR